MTAYARREVAATLLIGISLTAVVGLLWPWWALLPGLLTVALLSFYRDPRRLAPTGDNLLLAAADGRLLRIERGYRSAPGAAAELRFLIFLSLLDVHINRSPCGGRVVDVRYRPGRFLNALRAAASEQNESNQVTIQPEPPLPGPVHVRQIAGVLARRIVCAVRPGEQLRAGQRFGMIKFGSQTEIRVPEDHRWEVLVRPGQHVRAGQTILARLSPVPPTARTNQPAAANTGVDADKM